MALYQPEMQDELVRKLYSAAKRQGKSMTHVLNEIVADALVSEPEPPPYEKSMKKSKICFSEETSPPFSALDSIQSFFFRQCRIPTWTSGRIWSE